MTRVVTKGELARPVERLREQMEKLQLRSSRALSRPKRNAGMLEQQLAMAEERVERLLTEKQVAETNAERRVSSTEGWKRMEGEKQIRTDRRALKPVLTT